MFAVKADDISSWLNTFLFPSKGIRPSTFMFLIDFLYPFFSTRFIVACPSPLSTSATSGATVIWSDHSSDSLLTLV